MKRTTYLIIGVFLTIFLANCKKTGRIDYYKSDAAAPKQVTDVQVTATPGGAILTYKVPVDPSFSYAEADYEIQPGVFRQAKASYYMDTLQLVGFGDTLSHEVKIYSVGENERKSEPLSVKVNPLTPPVQSSFESISLVSTFGGVQVGFKNEAMANLAIVVMDDTTGLGTWSIIQTFYTGAAQGSFSIRGFDTTKRSFAVYIRDRWDNKSDTLIKSITPLFEEEIPKNTWAAVELPGDTYQPASSYVLSHLWDNNITGYPAIFASTNSSVLPQWFTIDLGVKVVISRIVEHQAQPTTSHFYQGSAPKEVEIWGSNNPDKDGSWSSWDSLGTFESFKPSGLPMGQHDSEDDNYGWLNGENFEFDQILPPYRYIRWKTLQTYGSSGQVVISELDVWGRIEQ
jgi:hypothetical protein